MSKSPKRKNLVSNSPSIWKRLTSITPRQRESLLSALSSPPLLSLLSALWLSVLLLRPKRSSQGSDGTVTVYLGQQFPEQWEEAEHIFRDLVDSRQWELRKEHSQLAVKLRYRKNFIFTWFSFLTAIALGSIKKAFYRLS